MNSTTFSSFLNGISSMPLFVLDNKILLSKYVSIDLSEQNLSLHTFDVSSSQAWIKFIDEYCHQKQAQVAYGGYNEKRNIYKRSAYFNQQNADTERNIHLGLDLWIAAGTAVFSPLEGVIHSLANNANYGDYGPTLILEHQINDVVFYTLYGHLSLDSLTDNKVGDSVKRGEQIATLGTAEVNGDYAPHLHFQIIHDLEGFEGDYPGVCSKKNLDHFLQNCPDPNLLLKLN
ncbi:MULTISPECIES: peptidoglycan DD-metalloendopeptidase family protein [Bizionia]|uniref:Peptidoglycan DD-metalloendopeptidase family protein n=1 Tax=Bizionia algoritergicola TaxID=291187 RepID=A0A5D0QT44_9FLAO|nr:MULTISPECIES: peptidoglycan DD-metalloendopeptidase family protein [Bizionia]OBX23214.1 peptidase M23 [Bizionia sp. APA-3]TYB71588.1 peptidoglycan DD-metalloendopeptidase family protein [Bizionia algoritergicola]